MAVDFKNPPALDENTKISHLEKFDSIAVLGTMVMFEIDYEKTVTAEEVMSCETLKDLYLLSVDNNGFSSLPNVRLAGLATAVPKRNLDNVEYGLPEFEEERGAVRQKRWCKQRRLAEKWQCFSDLHFLQLLN